MMERIEVVYQEKGLAYNDGTIDVEFQMYDPDFEVLFKHFRGESIFRKASRRWFKDAREAFAKDGDLGNFEMQLDGNNPHTLKEGMPTILFNVNGMDIDDYGLCRRVRGKFACIVVDLEKNEKNSIRDVMFHQVSGGFNISMSKGSEPFNDYVEKAKIELENPPSPSPRYCA